MTVQERLLMLLKACFSWIALASIASAQVTLQLKFPEGTTYETQTETKTTQTLTLAGMNIDTKTSAFIVSGATIGTRGANGVLKIEEKVRSMQTEMNLQGTTLQFDSANPDKKADNPALEPILDMYRAMYRMGTTKEVDAKNKLTAIKLPEGEVDKLPEIARSRYSPEALKKAVEQTYHYLPDGPINKGDTWERSSEINLGAGQTMTFRIRFQYDGTVEQAGVTLDKITGKAFEVSFAINGNPTLNVVKNDLKIVDSASTYLFDRQKGWAVSHSSKTQIAGPLTLVINGTELESKLDLTIEEKTTRQK